MAADKQSNQPGASMPLPDEAKSPNAAADLIRQKVVAAYAQEPDATEEAREVAGLSPMGKLSKHQQFIYDLTSSGKSLPEIQQAWHEYYAGLPDAQKHEVWQEFYDAHAQASHFNTQNQPSAPAASIASLNWQRASSGAGATISRTLGDLRNYVRGSLPPGRSAAKPVHSLMFGLSVGGVVMIIFLFGFFNERFIAPLIQPSRHVTNTPIISANTAGPNPEVIIPKINVEIPVVYGVNTIQESAVDKALETGVVHYADTAEPGQNGNIVIVGHSSNNIFNKGKYKFAFVLLSRLENGDTFYLDKEGKRYTYQVYKKQIVDPTDVSVLATADKPATATLITCDPPGTSLHRLVVVGQQINPDPISNAAQVAPSNLASQSAIIPGNATSLWSRFVHWFTH